MPLRAMASGIGPPYPPRLSALRVSKRLPTGGPKDRREVRGRPSKGARRHGLTAPAPSPSCNRRGHLGVRVYIMCYMFYI